MSRHSFDPEVAAQVGLNAAVIYQNILWWAEKNAANGRHVINGHVWTYNSRRAFAELFAYLTEKQIRVALDRLVEAGLLIKGNFNEAGYDRTSWYAPTCSAEWVSAIGPTGPAHWPQRANPLGVEGQPIPDSKPDKKPDGKPLGDFDAFWAEVPRKVGKEAAKRAYASALKKTDHDTIMAGIRRYAQERAGQDEKYTAHPASWLNAGRWDDVPASRPADFHKQLEDMFNGLELRDARLDDSPRAKQLPAPVSDAGSPDGPDGAGADQADGRGYQQEVARFIAPRRFGGAAW